MFTGFALTERNLIITGYIEPNKPRIGRQVAETLKMRFIDVEEQIEQRAGASLEEIRSQFGARRLKTLESEVMEEILLYRNCVIRVNGSTLLHSDHLETLRVNGPIFCLVARLDAILQRMHLAMGARYHDPSERAIALGELRREWAIRKLPGLFELDVTYQTEAEIIQSVLELWRQVSIQRG